MGLATILIRRSGIQRLAISLPALLEIVVDSRLWVRQVAMKSPRMLGLVHKLSKSAPCEVHALRAGALRYTVDEVVPGTPANRQRVAVT